MRVVIAPDKFKGTATASEVAAAVGSAAVAAGFAVVERPMADGGDGTLEVLGGANRATVVTGPHGQPVEAAWRLAKRTAVIEMALASGLVVAGGAEANDPLAATTRGTGELIDAAITRGAQRIIVGLGGSATTDGGLGAIGAIGSPARLAGVEVEAATDVTTKFVDAARVFGPQKGASEVQVAFLEARLRGLAERYREKYGVDVDGVPGAGAAGGLGGGLLALGASIVSGFELIADEVGLLDAIEQADVVVTGEGRLDAESFQGKVVGGVTEMAVEAGAHLVVIAGAVADDSKPLWPTTSCSVVSLTELFGPDRAMAHPLTCIRQAASRVLSAILE